MYYIKEAANASGSHGNPVSRQTDGMVALPDMLLTAYLDTMGFADLSVEDGTVTGVAVNQAALDAYLAEHPVAPEEDVPSAEEDLMTMAVDHEYRITMLELGVN